MSAFFAYDVTTRTSLPQYQFGQFSVTRRFRDFDWLHSQLGSKYPGAIVPPLPEKHSTQVSTMKVSGIGCSAEWLEERRGQLQKFLQRVCAHPQLHAALDLQMFLEASDDTLEGHKAAKQSKSSTMGMLTDMRSSATSAGSKAWSFMSSEPQPTVEMQTDATCQEMASYANNLSTQLQTVHKHTTRYLDRDRALAQTMSGFGLALTQLAQCEKEGNPSLGTGLIQMGLCVDQLSRVYEEQATKETEVFEEPIKEYVKVLAATKAAIHARELALKTMNNAALQLAIKKDKLEKARATGKEDKVAVLEREAREAESLDSCAKQDYAQISERVDAEMVRFKGEKLADFKHMMSNFIAVQIEYSQKVQNVWRDVMPHIDAIDTDEAAP